ncbi:isochorismate synthase [Zhihengliuella salsuginis]|uniref:isochorismate synthase n=1 Tax=Zhihengliuella salsuginis TaxID=578222 RepID=A0ABQ3GJX3_9MICC|nr:isochorismate synthase [Zhihengliuella salsuginis]GHD10233.1 isochorismate synthase [Zhihengliuella salsuginis]
MTHVLSAALPDEQRRTPTLRSATFERPAMADGGLLDYVVRGDTLVWGRRGDGRVGFGEVARFSTRGVDRFADARAWWSAVAQAADSANPLDLPGTGAQAFASFAFDETSDWVSTLIVPRLVVGRRGETSWLTIISDDPAEELTLQAAEEELAVELDAVDGEHELTCGGTLGPGFVDEDAFKEAVAAGVRAIESGELTKLVLARDAVAELDSPIAVAQVLRELAMRYGDCWTYSVDGLIGATPEMLVSVEGATAKARVLAGTLDRREAPADPEYPRRVLAGDEKQRHEHQLAIDSLTAELGPLVSQMVAPTEPFVLQLPNVWHLASDVEAHLNAFDDGRTPTALDLAEVLHPTAAVCGTPTPAAAAAIRRLEGMDRGPYAGPVGWVDTHGNGEFGIALRGGVVESPTRVRLFAGCGVVAASDPDAELAESWAKMRPMREALNL